MEKHKITIEKLDELEKKTKDKFTKLLVNDLKKKINLPNESALYNQLSYDRILTLIEKEENNNRLKEFKKVDQKNISYNLKVMRGIKNKNITINAEFSLDTLSFMIQKEFDLEPMHLYEFKIGKYKFGPKCDEWQEIFDALDNFKLGSAILASGLKQGDIFDFLYDLGDNIKFKIQIIEIYNGRC